MLEVVEQQEHRATADVLGEGALHAERLRDRLDDKRRLAQAGKTDPEDAIQVLADHVGGGLDRKPGLPRAPRSRQGDQPSAPRAKQGRDLGKLPLPSDKRRCWNRQIRVVERLQRRKIAGAELEQPTGSSKS